MGINERFWRRFSWKRAFTKDIYIRNSHFCQGETFVSTLPQALSLLDWRILLLALEGRRSTRACPPRRESRTCSPNCRNTRLMLRKSRSLLTQQTRVSCRPSTVRGHWSYGLKVKEKSKIFGRKSKVFSFFPCIVHAGYINLTKNMHLCTVLYKCTVRYNDFDFFWQNV